jgi:ribosomal protein S18 acetylase RimI-like enzyme
MRRSTERQHASGAGRLLLRRASPADHEALQRIYCRASLSNPGDRAALIAHPEFLRLDPELISRGRTWVAEIADDQTVVGFASTTRAGHTTLELEDLFVDPDCRRQGVARALVERIKAEAAAEQVARIRVTGNVHALSFYRAVGFTSETSIRTHLGAGLQMQLDTT